MDTHLSSWFSYVSFYNFFIFSIFELLCIYFDFWFWLLYLRQITTCSLVIWLKFKLHICGLKFDTLSI